MSISAQIADAISKMESDNPTGALFAICAAIEATAKKEYGSGGRTNYKRFVHSNLGLITSIGFGGREISNINTAFDHPKVKKDSNGLAPLQEILYHAVRCGLYHDASLPINLRFTNEGQIRVDNEILVLPSSLIYGLIIAVVTAPVNVHEVAIASSSLNLETISIPLSKLWGKREELIWLLATQTEARRMASSAAKE